MVSGVTGIKTHEDARPRPQPKPREHWPESLSVDAASGGQPRSWSEADSRPSLVDSTASRQPRSWGSVHDQPPPSLHPDAPGPPLEPPGPADYTREVCYPCYSGILVQPLGTEEATLLQSLGDIVPRYFDATPLRPEASREPPTTRASDSRPTATGESSPAGAGESSPAGVCESSPAGAGELSLVQLAPVSLVQLASVPPVQSALVNTGMPPLLPYTLKFWR